MISLLFVLEKGCRDIELTTCKINQLLAFRLKHSGVLNLDDILSCKNLYDLVRLVHLRVSFFNCQEKLKVRWTPDHCAAEQVNEVLEVVYVEEILYPSNGNADVEVKLDLA